MGKLLFIGVVKPWGEVAARIQLRGEGKHLGQVPDLEVGVILPAATWLNARHLVEWEEDGDAKDPGEADNDILGDHVLLVPRPKSDDHQLEGEDVRMGALIL